MVGTVLLIILFVLCVLLLLPVRVTGWFRDGKWAVTVYYAFIRVFHKESEEKPEPQKPLKPEDLPEGEAPPPNPKTEKPEQSKTPDAPAKPEPAAAEIVPKPETVTDVQPAAKPQPESEPALHEPEPVDPEALADDPDIQPISGEEPCRKRRKKKEKQDEALTDAEPEKEKPKKRGFIRWIKPDSLKGWLRLAKDGLGALPPALRFLTRHLHFRHVKLYLAVASDDPANTATLYGKICAAACNLLAVLQCWVDIETDEIRILADFYNESITFSAALELRVSPAAAILMVLILGIRFLINSIRTYRAERKDEKLRAKETAPAEM
ncbi:MAG: hypothetical protein MJ065_02205 [Oscillospiraceae bacterium]|nr:hypothetical protein [Oscillospiraceae bacterium]